MTAAVKVVATRIDQFTDDGRFQWADFAGAANGMDNSGVQDIFDLDTRGLTRISIQIIVATATLAAFQIRGLASTLADGTKPSILRSTAAQFTAPSGILIDASGDLTVQIVGFTGWFILNCAGFPMIRLSANSSGAASTLQIVGSGI